MLLIIGNGCGKRHGARHANVVLSTKGGGFQIAVRDDGKGFDVAAARKRAAAGASMGLLSMEERVSIAGGQLTIESVPGQGTTVRARFPLSQTAGAR